MPTRRRIAMAFFCNRKFIGPSVRMAMAAAVAVSVLVKQEKAEDVREEAKASDD